MVATAASLTAGQMAGLIGLSSLGSFAGTGLGALFSGHKMHKQYKYQRELQKQAAELNYNYSMASAQNLALNSPSWQREGLEQAGYNPLLAVGNFNTSPATGFTSAGSAGIATDPTTDFSGDITNAYKAFNLGKKQLEKDIKVSESVIKNNDANTANAYQQAETEKMKREHYQSMIDLNMINRELGRKDLEWKDREKLMNIETSYANAAANRLGAQAAMSNATTAQKVYELNDLLNTGEKEKARLIKEILNSGVGEYGFKYDWIRNHYPNPGNALKFGLGAYGVNKFGKFQPNPLSKYQDRLH